MTLLFFYLSIILTCYSALVLIVAMKIQTKHVGGERADLHFIFKFPGLSCLLT